MFKLKKIGIFLLFLAIIGLGMSSVNATNVRHAQAHVNDGKLVGDNNNPFIYNLKSMWDIDSDFYSADYDYVRHTICPDLINKGYAKLIKGKINGEPYFYMQITNKSTSVEKYGYLEYYQERSWAWPDIRYRITVNNGNGNLF